MAEVLKETKHEDGSVTLDMEFTEEEWQYLEEVVEENPEYKTKEEALVAILKEYLDGLAEE